MRTVGLGWTDRIGVLLIIGGLAGGILGLASDPRRFAFAWLLGCVFFVSLCLGSLFLVIVHHLLDAGWSVSIRRICEHIACMIFPWVALAFLPLAYLGRYIYPWEPANESGSRDFASMRGGGSIFLVWCMLSVLFFGAWSWLSHGLRRLSLEQDKSGAAVLTRRLRRLSAGGAFVFAITLTGAAVVWMKWLDKWWVSTIYGACFFTSCVWFAVAVVWFLAVVLRNDPRLKAVLGPVQFHSLGVLFLAFTLLHAYTHYSQYFVIWNANLPNETAWYIIREQGTWFHAGVALVFGHFVLPLLVLLRANWKLQPGVVVAICVWAWLMHYLDIAFNVLPVVSGAEFPLRSAWMDFSSIALVGGFLLRAFARDYVRHPAYPARDPRLEEALTGIGRSFLQTPQAGTVPRSAACGSQSGGTLGTS